MRGEGELTSWAGGRGACSVLVRLEGQHAVLQAANRGARTKWKEEKRGRTQETATVFDSRSPFRVRWILWKDEGKS